MQLLGYWLRLAFALQRATQTRIQKQYAEAALHTNPSLPISAFHSRCHDITCSIPWAQPDARGQDLRSGHHATQASSSAGFLLRPRLPFPGCQGAGATWVWERGGAIASSMTSSMRSRRPACSSHAGAASLLLSTAAFPKATCSGSLRPKARIT